MTKKCDSTIVFVDDFGDNDTTFHCILRKGHKGLHMESDTLLLEGQHYILKWSDYKPKIE